MRNANPLNSGAGGVQKLVVIETGTVNHNLDAVDQAIAVFNTIANKKKASRLDRCFPFFVRGPRQLREWREIHEYKSEFHNDLPWLTPNEERIQFARQAPGQQPLGAAETLPPSQAIARQGWNR